MRCPCPKCDAMVEMSWLDIPAAGDSQRCPECNEKYWIRREAFLLRAFKKQGRIYCFDCGHELGSDMLCMHCLILCPDYCVVQSSKFVGRNQSKDGSIFSPARRPKLAAPLISSKEVPKPAAPLVSSSESSKQQANMNWLKYVAFAVMALVLVGGVTKVYLDHKVNQQYSKKFIATLYGIKSGTDFSLKLIAETSSKWKDTLGTINIAPRTSKHDLDKLIVVKARINESLDNLNESPEKFIEAREKLIKLHSIYEEIYTLNISYPESLGSFTLSKDKLETSFFKAAADLKSSMPEELIDELKVSVAKYRNLGFLIKGT